MPADTGDRAGASRQAKLAAEGGGGVDQTGGGVRLAGRTTGWPKILAGALTVMVLSPAPAVAGLLDRIAGRAAVRGSATGLRASPPHGIRRPPQGQLLRRDLARDRATRARPLDRERTVFRYTTRERVRIEARRGLSPGAHLTARATPGRPLGSLQAQRRYGLPARPEVRERVRVPKGHPVRPNRVLGGSRGVGELTSPKRLPPGAIAGVVPLRRDR